MSENVQRQFEYLRRHYELATLSAHEGNYPLALDSYRITVNGLDVLVEEGIPTEMVSSQALLKVNAVGNYGFILGRTALVDNDSALLDDAIDYVTYARVTTNPYIAGDLHLTSRRDRGSMIASDAKIKGYMSRLTTAKLLRYDKPLNDQDLHWWGLAYKIALGGNSALIGAEISVKAARVEAIKGRQLHAAEWLRRASSFIDRPDMGNTRQRSKAVTTIARHVPELRNPDLARAAALHHRKI